MKKHGVAVDLVKRGGELGGTEGEEVKLGCIICGRPNKNDTLANKYKKKHLPCFLFIWVSSYFHRRTIMRQIIAKFLGLILPTWQ